MVVDLEKGISLKIEGELGRFHTLPIESLIKISNSLQELVLAIAKYDLSESEAIDLNNFKIELSAFNRGSAIPSFNLTERIQPTIGDYKTQRNKVSEKLNNILDVSDKGDYLKLSDLYPEAFKRNEIVNKLYDFTSSFKNSPYYIYEKGKSDYAYKPKKFKKSAKNSLLVDIVDSYKSEEKEEEEVWAKVRVIKKGTTIRNNVLEKISLKNHSLSYSPDIINVNSKQYLLHYPLRCLLVEEDDYYMIKNEQLDIIATGLSVEETENNFNEEFDYLYNRLNSLDQSVLSDRFINVRHIINSYVKEVH